MISKSFINNFLKIHDYNLYVVTSSLVTRKRVSRSPILPLCMMICVLKLYHKNHNTTPSILPVRTWKRKDLGGKQPGILRIDLGHQTMDPVISRIT